MIRRLLPAASLLAAIALLALTFSGSATAAPYPPSNTASVSASAYDPCAGTSNIIGGNGFQPGETVRIVLAGRQVATAVAAADGTFSVTITVPANARGNEQLTATGATSGLSASLRLAVGDCTQSGSDKPIGGGGGLAYTGVAVGGALLAAALLLGGGAALLVASRRRRGTSALG